MAIAAVPSPRVETPDVTEIKLGRVAFYGAVIERHSGDEYVRYFISSEVFIRDGLIENNGKSVLVDRRTWDEMAAAVGAAP